MLGVITFFCRDEWYEFVKMLVIIRGMVWKGGEFGGKDIISRFELVIVLWVGDRFSGE